MAAVWCLETLQELLSNVVSKDYCRKYRGSNMVLLVDTFTNKKGVFLKFTKLFSGTLKNIIVPAGRFKWGWRRMLVCLDNLVGKRFWAPKGSGVQDGLNSDKSYALDRKGHHRETNNLEKNQCSWRDVVGTRAEEHRDSLNKRN